MTSTPATVLSASISESEMRRIGLSSSTSWVETVTRAETLPMIVMPLLSPPLPADCAVSTCPSMTSTSTSLFPSNSNADEVLLR